MKFFNIPTIEEDEHIYSYFLRTGHANGFSFKDLHALTCYHGKNTEAVRCDYETILGFTRMYEMYDFDQNNENYESPISFYKKTSIYNGIAPFSTQTKLKKITERLNKYYYSDSKGGGIANVKELLLCPECMQNEIDNKGFFYYHRAHQMPGVAVCHKHNCRLKKYNGPIGEELTFPLDLVDAEIHSEICDQHKYAVFCKDVLDRHYQPIDGHYQICNYLRKLSDDSNNGKIAAKQQLSKMNGLRLMIYCFSIFKNSDRLFLEAFNDENNLFFLRIIEKFNGYVFNNSSEFELSSEYNKNSLKNEDARFAVVRHKKCNTQFMVRIVDFLSGDDCPYCNSLLSPEERCKKKIHYVVNRNKFLIKLYIDPSDSRIDAYNCERLGKYNILGLEENNHNYVVNLKHRDCGTVFKKSFNRFISSPWCPNCHQSNIVETAESFERAIKNLVGDEYTVLDEYKSAKHKIRFRHNVCGKISTMYSYQFLDGQRCAHCSREMPASEFKKMVMSVSYGRYICEKIDHTRCLIKDTKTGQSKDLSRKRVIQELFRYDKNSNILPLKKRNDNYSLYKPQYDILYERLCENFKENDIFFSFELSNFKNGLTSKMSNLISQLLKKQKIYNLAFRTYALSPIEVSNEDVVYAKFINRRGTQIGYFKAESFAYDIGLTSEKPKTINMCSNDITNKQGETVMQYDLPIRINPVLTMVDNQNWPIIATLDFMQSAKNKGFDYNELGPLKNWLISQNIKLEDFEDYYQYVSPWVWPKIRIIYEEN